MSYQTPAQLQRRSQVQEARTRLVDLLHRTVGPAMTAEEAQSLLQKAQAWSPLGARLLDSHVRDAPDALTAPSAHCPMSLVRLLQQLDAAGHGANVTQLGCAICSTTGRKITRLTPQGRACDWCVHRNELKPCARCGKDGHIVTRKEGEGLVCRTCYQAERQQTAPCAGCGRIGTYQPRRKNGTTALLCLRCTGRPQHVCVRCGQTGPVQSNFKDTGPICDRCYTPPAGPCRRCGRIRPIAKRGEDGQPGTCYNCHYIEGDCTACGRHRRGNHCSQAGGVFLCRGCQTRPAHPCGFCGQKREANANWPVGPVCGPCYAWRRSNPAQCARCGVLRVLVGRDDDGRELCGPCCGTDIDFACLSCGYPGDIHKDGRCLRCVVRDRVHDLLSDEKGNISPDLAPLIGALTSAPVPGSVMTWLRRSPSARLLATLAAGQDKITHDLLDDLPQDQPTQWVRKLLVDTQVLPARPETLVRLELWFAKLAKELPAHHARIVRPFAEWSVIRDARRRAARGPYSVGAATIDRGDIRAAIDFLSWLDENQTDLADLAQPQLDVWLTTATPFRLRGIGTFIRWTNQRRLTQNLQFPTRPRSVPATFHDEQEHEEQLRRCLTDHSLPLELRIAGALIRLYGLPIFRMVRLTTDDYRRDDNGAYLTFDKNPVLLPPTLARMIEKQIAEGRTPSAVSPPQGEQPALLLPGRPASRPRCPTALSTKLRKAGLPTIAARNTAMIGMASELPPIIISDLFGIHKVTATRWAALAQDSWADYLAACEISR